jgi:DnaK suppressor protein
MTLRKRKLEEFRNQLLDRRAEVAREVSADTAELLREESAYADSIDQASADVDRTWVVQKTNRDRELLAQIEIALRRVEDGTFGECENCGDDIQEARMKAQPATTLCVGCQAELESTRHRYSSRLGS